MQTKEQSIFMSQYLWQKVFISPKEKFNPVLLTPQDLEFRVPEFGGYLQLRSIEQLTDEEITELMYSIGLRWPEIDSKDDDSILIVDDSYSVGLYFDGTVVMYKGRGMQRKPYWNDIKALYDGLIQLGVCLSKEAITKGWAVIKEDGV